jgi:hypothetical protein
MSKLRRVRAGLYEYADPRGMFVIRNTHESSGAPHSRSNLNPWLVKFPDGRSASVGSLTDAKFLIGVK